MQQRRIRYSASFLLVAVLVVMVAASPITADSGGRYDVKFTGVIESIGPDQWVVAGQTIVVTKATEMHSAGGNLAPGQWADIMMERQGDGSWLALWITLHRPEARLKGPVLEVPEGGLGIWNIAGQDFLVIPATRISERIGPVGEGFWVEVFWVQDDEGNLVVVRMRGAEPQQAVHVYGAIEAFVDTAWTLSGATVAVDEATQIAREPMLGVLAHAEASLLADDTLLAYHLNPVWIEPGGARPEVNFLGIVEDLPEHGLNGVWTVDGQTVVVTENTLIHQTKGLVELGSEVHVLGWQQGEQIVAFRITVLTDQVEGNQYLAMQGQVEEMPPNGQYGVWEIGGHQVQVGHQTRVDDGGAAQIGAPAEVGAVRRQNGEMVATWLRVRPAANAPNADLTCIWIDGELTSDGSCDCWDAGAIVMIRRMWMPMVAR